MPVRVVFLKIGFLGITPLIEGLLDERANRKDINVKVVGSGVKLKEDDAQSALKLLEGEEYDIVVLVAPNAGDSGPALAWRELSKRGRPVIVVSDSPLKKVTPEIEGAGAGYLIVEADSMLGARREFLDPIEMALFNSDVIRVLAVTGAFRHVQRELDRVISELAHGRKPSLPRVVVDKGVVWSDGEFSNPYAQAKALASFEIAKRVGAISSEGMYKVKEREHYLPIVTAAHEMMRHAAMLADEARELEKAVDGVLRTPHLDDGKMGSKTKLFGSIG